MDSEKKTKVLALVDWLAASRSWVGEFSIGNSPEAVRIAYATFPIEDGVTIWLVFVILAMIQIHVPGMAVTFRELAGAVRGAWGDE